jgi:AAHS family 4-hydroxybenzoate transporter-like MFS transporter
MRTVDVGHEIDEGRWTGYQKLLVFGTALAIILDGVDNQLLPNTIPTLITEWGQPRAAFTNAQSSGPWGMMIGGLIGGAIGDRFGRRPALLLSVVTFALVTIAISFVNSLEALLVLRFLAGVGLGGAMPNAATLASEYVPRRQRPSAVTMTIVCIPLGGFVAAELAARVIPAFGWRSLFMIGGIIPLVLAVVLWMVLPESPRFLARRKERWPELTRVMRRIGHDVPDDVQYLDAAAQAARGVRKGSMGDLFAPAYLRDTLALCASFFFCLMVNYVAIQWVPAMLAGGGFAQPAANRGLTMVNIGGVIGALAGGFIIQRLGSRLTMLSMSAVAVVCSLAMAGMKLDPTDAGALMAMFLITGGLLNAVQTTMYALAAHVFPTEIRSTGVGTAVAVGRVGNAMAAYVGSYALDRGGSAGYFTSWAILMALVFVALALVMRHVPRASGVEGAAVAAPASH